MSVEITGPQSLKFLTEIFSSSTKVQIYYNDCTLINEQQFYLTI